jgi:hypothetical protein
MNIGIGNYVVDWELAQQLGMKVAIVAAIIVITWALAKGAKWAFARLVNQVPVLQRQGGNGESVGESLGKIVSLLIWLLGLIAVLQRLGLSRVIQPLQTLLDQVMGFIPNIVGAGVILFVGLIVARIVRQLVETTLSTINLDKWAARGNQHDQQDDCHCLLRPDHHPDCHRCPANAGDFGDFGPGNASPANRAERHSIVAGRDIVAWPWLFCRNLGQRDGRGSAVKPWL